MVGAMSADAVVQGSIDPPAIIGKLPGHGDFLARGVDYALREPLDHWMSEWMGLAREELNEGFETAYEVSAPWLYESARVNAVLMPSVDAVGRLFPVLGVCSANVRTQAIYDTLINALETGMKADALRGQMNDLPRDCTPTDKEADAEWFLPEGAEPSLPSPGDVESWVAIREHLE